MLDADGHADLLVGAISADEDHAGTIFAFTGLDAGDTAAASASGRWVATDFPEGYVGWGLACEAGQTFVSSAAALAATPSITVASNLWFSLSFMI